jgi:hypothetical protein
MLSGRFAPLAFCYFVAGALTVALWTIASSGGVSQDARTLAAWLLKLLLLAYALFGGAMLLFGVGLVTGWVSRDGSAFFVGLFLVLPFALMNFVPGMFLLVKSPNPLGLDSSTAARGGGASVGSTLALGVAGFFGAAAVLGVAGHFVHRWWAAADERALSGLPRGNRYFDAATYDAEARYFATRTLNPRGTVLWAKENHRPTRQSNDDNARLLHFESAGREPLEWIAEAAPGRNVLRIGSPSDSRNVELRIGEEIIEVVPIGRSQPRIAVMTSRSLQLWSLNEVAQLARIPHERGGVPLQTNQAFKHHWNYHLAVDREGTCIALAVGDDTVIIMDPAGRRRAYRAHSGRANRSVPRTRLARSPVLAGWIQTVRRSRARRGRDRYRQRPRRG